MTLAATTVESTLVEEAVALRRRLHRMPELSGAEHETTAIVRRRLSELGLDAVDCPTPTGAVALLDTGRPGRRVMLRADIDALPVTESSGEPFTSEVPGLMHGCGHDGHTAILLAVAERLAATDGLSGSFCFCFQPAEETLSGARAMVAGGLMEALQPDRVIGLHLSSLLPSGEVHVRAGIQLAWAAGFRITLKGGGGHNATSGRTVNQRLGELCLRMPGLAGGLSAEGAAATAAIGNVTTDGAWNTSPTHAELWGTHRAFSAAHHEELNLRLRRLVEEIGGDLEITATAPAVVNDAATVAELAAACDALNVPVRRLEKPLVFADDVAEFLNRAAGCYFMLGARPADLEVGAPHHAPEFRIDEGAFATGIAVLVNLAARLAADTRPLVTGEG